MFSGKAVRINAHGGPEVLTLEPVVLPAPPPADAVYVKNHFSGINMIDVYFRKGAYAVDLPTLLGQEGAGEVIAVGDAVTNVNVGDRVAFNSKNSSYTSHASISSSTCVRIPDGVSTKQAAAVLLQGMTAHYLVHDCHPVKTGETVLVHAAAGGTGRILCGVARALGARVIGTVSTEAKAEVARAAGAHETILYTQKDFVEETLALTDGQGVHAIFDGVGRTTCLPGFKCLRPRGSMVLFGAASGQPDPIDVRTLTAGSFRLTRPILHHFISEPGELARRSSDVFAWLANGTVTLDPSSITIVPLSDAARAHQLLEGRATTGKLLLDCEK